MSSDRGAEQSFAVEDSEKMVRQAEACQKEIIGLFKLDTKERETNLVRVCNLARTMTVDHLDLLESANQLNDRLQMAANRVLETGWATESFGGWEGAPKIYEHPWESTYSLIAGSSDGTIRGHLHNIGTGIGNYSELTGTVLVKWILGLHIYKAIQEKKMPPQDEVVDSYARKYFAKIFGERKFGGTINRVAYLSDTSDVYAWENRKAKRKEIFLASNGALPTKEFRADSHDIEPPSAVRPWSEGSKYDAIFVGELITFLEEPGIVIQEQGLPPGVIQEPEYSADARAIN